MLDGLMLQEGTLAYRAPEVIRGETYSFKVKITLYLLMSFGKKVSLTSQMFQGLLSSHILRDLKV